jgi:hypothetical protein
MFNPASEVRCPQDTGKCGPADSRISEPGSRWNVRWIKYSQIHFGPAIRRRGRSV